MNQPPVKSAQPFPTSALSLRPVKLTKSLSSAHDRTAVVRAFQIRCFQPPPASTMIDG